MRTWIIIDGEKTGPFDIAQVARRIESGELKPEQYGWIEGMREWQPLSQMPQFSDAVASVSGKATPSTEETSLEVQPPPLPSSTNTQAPPSRAAAWNIPPFTPREKTIEIVRRFFARWFDFMLITNSIFVAIIIAGENLKALFVNPWFQYSIMVAWILLDSATVHIWKTSPGKFLLGLRVHRADGSRLSAGASILRAARVFVMGMGMVHPILLPLCHGFSWWFTKKFGASLWDGPAGNRITTLPISVWRWALFILVAFTVVNVSGIFLEPITREMFLEMFPDKAHLLPPPRTAP
jgi:uncharacterized RDD family membrane protein YckC